MLHEAEKALQRYYGYQTFREGQKPVITSILRGKDTLAVMPTGGGKSICYQIPALLLPGVTLVISPLISLMKDQVDALHSVGIPATYINSSLDSREAAERISRARKGAFKLIYVAPERLETDSFCSLADHLPISLVAVDEAHCVSQWGHDFRPSYLAIAAFMEKLLARPIMAAFTATATPEVQADILERLALSAPEVFVTGFYRENLAFSVVKSGNKSGFVLKYLSAHPEQAGIIYAATRKEVDNLYAFLRKNGYAAGKYHAGMSDAERTASQEAFLFDEIRLIVATNAFGMGIDKSNVRFVIHYNLPKNMEAYFQEAGRAGRDGEPSECILLFAPQDVQIQKYLIEQSVEAADRKPLEYEKLQSMVGYCHTTRCLQQYMLQYFGEQDLLECGVCSNCSSEAVLTDMTTIAQKIFSCIRRMNERFGVKLVAQVLKGANTQKVRQFKFEQLSTYGIMAEYTEDQISGFIHLLIAEEYIRMTDSQYPVLSLLPKAFPVLSGEERVYQRVWMRQLRQSGDDALFEQLRQLRRELAQRDKVPPYIIFADSALREMSQSCPMSEAEFLQVKGVGEQKAKKYGPPFLAAIRQYVAEHGSSRAAGEPEQTEAAGEAKKVPSHLLTLQMYQAGKTLKEIAAERKLGLVTIQDHLLRCGREGHDVDWGAFIPAAHEAAILAAVRELGSEKLRPIKEQLPEEVDYMAIKAVIAKYAGAPERT
ncbi:DNA helicase RecQ [Brevibacillus massiliensis]|jgi:ATP-dependent DNA helicase RecQ|uniref:DNA helicase RecQ n=1 Tax=Brevibacillus massiliensis TaxID=1118054 RepID=UPI00030DD60D|nr:DNA helicase RecQ [Brevibacillus massiliensis]